MFKKIMITLLLLGGIGTGIWFYTEKKVVSDSLKVIPKEASMVTTIDVFSLARKGKLSELPDMRFIKALRREARNENKKLARMLDEVMENPLITGIDITQELVVFYVNEGSKNRFICFSFGIQDEEVFADFFADFIRKTGGDFDLEEEKRYQYIKNNKAAFGWNNENFLGVIAENYASRKQVEVTLDELFQLKEKSQIRQHKEFNAFYKNRKDVSVWVSTNILENDYSFNKLAKELEVDILDNYAGFHLSFEEDEINLVAEIKPNKDIQKELDKHDIWKNGCNPKLLRYLPKEYYATASFSINPVGYYDLLKDQKDFSDFEDSFERTMQMSMDKAFESLRGSVVFSFSDIEEMEYTYMTYEYDEEFNYRKVEKTKTSPIPIMNLAIDLNNSKLVTTILDQVPENLYEQKGDYYEFKIDKKFPAYFAYDERAFIVTNDQKVARKFSNGGLDRSLSDSNLANEMTNNILFAALKLDTDEYPALLQTEMRKNTDRKMKVFLTAWNERVKEIQLKQVSGNKLELSLKMKNGNGNSLHAILMAVDENFKKFM